MSSAAAQMSLNKIFHNPAQKTSNHHDNKQQGASERWCTGPSLIFSIFLFFPVIWDLIYFSSPLLTFTAHIRFTRGSYLSRRGRVITFSCAGCHIPVVSAVSQGLPLMMYGDLMSYKSFWAAKKSWNRKMTLKKGNSGTHTHTHTCISTQECLWTVIG